MCKCFKLMSVLKSEKLLSELVLVLTKKITISLNKT